MASQAEEVLHSLDCTAAVPFFPVLQLPRAESQIGSLYVP